MKKIVKNNNFIILTEKEIHLIELLLKNTNPITKEVILSSVWNYSSDADTHTVETHIYRLRKKLTTNLKITNLFLIIKMATIYEKKKPICKRSVLSQV